MSVRFYQFGTPAGGTDSNGNPIAPGAAPFGTPEILSGVLAAGANTFTFSTSLKHIRIANTHDSAALDYSFDGLTWATLIAYQTVQEPSSSATVLLRPTVAGTFPTYELFGILQG
jgi:hypothetical protein